MPWAPERSSVNQTLQFGLEATPGVNVPANKLLQCFDIQLGAMADVKPYEPTGRKYPSIVIENSEWVEGTLGGELDYNGMGYALAGVCGAPVISAVGASAIAKSWVFTPPVTGSVQPQTFTIEQGENNAYGNAIYNHKVNYGLISELGYKGDRKAGFTVSGKVLAQALQRAITMTATPTAVALQPSAGKHFNFYLDATSAGLGTTQLLKVLNVDFSFANLYGMFFPMNRANLGYAAHVDLNPTCAIKLLLEADAIGMTPLSYLQAGTTMFLRVAGQGLVIDNNQTVTLGTPSAGNFTLTYKGQTTGNIAYNATSAAVATALQGLSTIGATGCTVAGGPGNTTPFVVTFTGLLATDTTPLTGSGAGLTGGAFAITQTQVYALFQHDMAVKVSKPSPFSDKDGVFAEEWEFTIVEDATWGAAHRFTIQTLLTAL